MVAQDWFRREEWTPATREEFFRRLKRARDKGQYLKIQALTLQSAGDYSGALELVDYFFLHYSEQLWNAEMHGCRALAHVALGEFEPAITAFRDALEAERQFPGIQTDSWLDFGEFVVLTQHGELYSEVLDLLQEFEGQRSLVFPVQRFRLNAIRALIHAHRGDAAKGRNLATAALTHAAQNHSGTARHPTVGLLAAGHQDLLTAVARLAAA